jgi:hypothetical protein
VAETVTIISAVYGEPACWQRNLGLVTALNPEPAWRWIVVDNSDEPVLEPPEDTRATVLRGSPNPRVRDGGSLHHAMALEMGLARAETRHVLLMDHDFFVMRRGWIAAVLGQMHERGLALFGAPWNPRWFYEWRGFPSVHFMALDLERIPRAQLDFRPHIDGDLWWKLVSERLPLPRAMRETLMVGRCRDTGYRAREQFAAMPFELLVPHYAYPDDARVAWERWLPARFRKYPDDDGSHTGQSVFRDHFPEAYSRRWEEFFWKGAPFGFHLRGVGRFQSGDLRSDDPQLLDDLLDAFAAGQAPWWP